MNIETFFRPFKTAAKRTSNRDKKTSNTNKICRNALGCESLETRAMLAAVATSDRTVPIAPPMTATSRAAVSPLAAAPVSATPTVPGTPTVIEARGGQARLTWAASVSSKPISGYTVQYSLRKDSYGNSLGPASNWQTFGFGVSTNSNSVTVTGLKNSSYYIFKVAAVYEVRSSLGPRPQVVTGTYSNASSMTYVSGQASPVRGLTASLNVQGAWGVKLAWSPPASNGGSPITRYDVYYKTSSDWSYTLWKPKFTPVGTNTSTVVTGLTSGRTYNFYVQPVTANGTGETASVTFTPRL